MKNLSSNLTKFGLSLLFFALSNNGFAEECTWQNKYKYSGYHLGGSQSGLIGLETSSQHSSARQVLLANKRHEGSITQKERVELEALETTKNPRVALLATKKFEGAITPSERVELDTLKSTGNPRQAFLAVAKFEGKLKDTEKVELEALERSGGDELYVNLKLKKLKGEKLTECEAQELSYIERSVASPGVALPVSAPASKAAR